MNIIYPSFSRHPGDRANAVQVMHMAGALGQLAHTRLIIPDHHPHMSDDAILAHYGLEKTFALTRLKFFNPQFFFNQAWLKRLHHIIYRYSVDSFVRSLRRDVTTHVSAHDIFYLRNLELLPALPSQARCFMECHQFADGDAVFDGRVRGLIAINSALGRHLRERHPALPVCVEHDGVRSIPDDAPAGRPAGPFIFGYVGRFNTMGREKGLPELLRSFARLRHQDACLRLVGARDEAERSRYEAVGLDCGLSSRRLQVQLGVAPAKVMDCIRNLDCCILPLLDDSHNLSPLKLFEYMASGVPLIATRLPAHLDVLRAENAMLVDPAVDGLLHGLEYALHHGEHMHAMAQQARLDVRRHTWSARARRILDFMHGVCPA